MHFTLSGLQHVEPAGQTITLSASSPSDTNSISEPAKLVPVTAPAEGLSKDFTRTFPPYSITVLRMKAR